MPLETIMCGERNQTVSLNTEAWVVPSSNEVWLTQLSTEDSPDIQHLPLKFQQGSRVGDVTHRRPDLMPAPGSGFLRLILISQGICKLGLSLANLARLCLQMKSERAGAVAQWWSTLT